VVSVVPVSDSEPPVASSSPEHPAIKPMARTPIPINIETFMGSSFHSHWAETYESSPALWIYGV